MNRLTVFTPTYNRVNTIPRLLESLLKQTNHQFEWLVIDDGSTDGTEAFFSQVYRDSVPFPLHYIKVENGGKQRAINLAVSKINTEYIFIVDSDDYLLCNAIEKVLVWINDNSLTEEFAGVSGVKGKAAGRPLGGDPAFSGEYIDATNLERMKYNLTADMAEVYRTDVLRKHPFFVWPGEKFVPEAVVWDALAMEGYKLRWYKDVIYICEYQEDGLTKSGWSLLKKNPMGYAMLFDSQQKTSKSRYRKWKQTAQMMGCVFLAGEWQFVKGCSSPARALICAPLGFAISIRRRLQFAKEDRDTK